MSCDRPYDFSPTCTLSDTPTCSHPILRAWALALSPACPVPHTHSRYLASTLPRLLRHATRMLALIISGRVGPTSPLAQSCRRSTSRAGQPRRLPGGGTRSRARSSVRVRRRVVRVWRGSSSVRFWRRGSRSSKSSTDAGHRPRGRAWTQSVSGSDLVVVSTWTGGCEVRVV